MVINLSFLYMIILTF